MRVTTLDYRSTLVVENGAMSIAYNDHHPPAPDWDAYARRACERLRF